MKRLSLIGAALGIFYFAPLLYGCEPCSEILSFEETTKKANLIIIGQKAAEGQHTDLRPEGYGGFDWIDIRIIKVLEGETSQDQIRVKSYDAMCDYGITVDDKTYVIFLARYEDRNTNDKIQNLLEQKQAFLNIKEDEFYDEKMRDAIDMTIKDFNDKIKKLEAEKIEYDAVNNGCAVKTFLYQNGKVDFHGELISLDDFMAKL